MQKWFFQFAGLSLALTIILASGCTDDPIVEPSLGPDVRFVTETDYLSGDADVVRGEFFQVKVTVDKGDGKLKSFTIYEGSDKLATARFDINNGAITSNNPFLITGVDQDGATYEFKIASLDTEAATTYTFEATDENNLQDEVSLVVTTKAPATTPIEMSLSGVLFNASGPAGTGGLDLDTGTGTGSQAAGAEIRDMGINCGVNPPAWRQQIGTVNGAVMRRVRAEMVENFSFANATTKEIIAAAYETGSEITSDLPTLYCNPDDNVVVTDVTLPLVVGDMFAISANGKIYLIRVDEINDVAADNSDNYKMSIKY